MHETGPSDDGGSLAPGLITLGVTYIASVAIGQFAEAELFDPVSKTVGGGTSVDYLWIPIAGPWLGLANNEGTVRGVCTATPGCTTDGVTAGSLAMIVGGVAQAVGVTITISALIRRSHGGGHGDLDSDKHPSCCCRRR